MRLLRFRVLVAGLGALPLAGCLTSGTNMHGDFACRAPGGTCAPMTRIDAAAVATLGAASQPFNDTGTIDVIPRNGRMVTARTVTSMPDGSSPGRTSDRVLRIVFPAHIDASGVYHDEAAAHAVVERGVWSDGLTGGRRNAIPVAGRAEIGQKAAGTASPAPATQLATLEEIIALQAARRREAAPATTQGSLARERAVPPSAGGALASPLEPLRYPSSATLELRPIALREAAAAATAPPVANLEANYDTPDVVAVMAVMAADPSPVGATPCVGYRIVRWHGHDYRRPYQRRCGTSAAPGENPQSSPLRVASAASALPIAATAELPTLQNGNPATAALNRAQLQRVTASPAGQAIASTSAASAAATTTASAALPATSDPETAKTRVDAMASPILGAVIEQGRTATADEGAALKSGLDRLTTGFAAFTSASGPAQARSATGMASASEPRP